MVFKSIRYAIFLLSSTPRCFLSSSLTLKHTFVTSVWWPRSDSQWCRWALAQLWPKYHKSNEQEGKVGNYSSAGGEKQSELLQEPFAPPDISDSAEYFKCWCVLTAVTACLLPRRLQRQRLCKAKYPHLLDTTRIAENHSHTMWA